ELATGPAETLTLEIVRRATVTQSVGGRSMPSSVDPRISVVQGDIARLEVDVVVTAANEGLLGGGGVDGAVHRAAGPGLLEECRTLGGCPEGQARITGGYRLHARHVIHAVGPVWDGGDSGERKALASCYRAALELAAKHALASIAFPCIATGVYGFPKDEACGIAVSTIREWLRRHEYPQEVVFCCFHEEDVGLYRARLATNSE
ncbi:MAG TPA: O-acetyl-ADP-ribose deacetylase, partial [Planctomycetaceae bacterium]|nr:O-acetyl-ADP-ribose deacetylase [Planctomycetaceae bacterium]